MPTITLQLPDPYPLQQDIMTHPAKRKVICAGRRAGKTTLAALIAVERFLDGDRCLLTSTTQDQADAFWDKAKTWLSPLIQVGLVSKNESRRLLHFPGGGRIRVKTGSNPDVLRGDNADLVVFDECALLDPAAWFAVAAPMLADRDGDAVFISTPQRRNWFYHLYQRAVDDTDDRWQAWHFTTHANPHLSRAAVRELGADMTAATYRQEILAEFLEGDGQVFRKVREAAVLEAREPYEGVFVMGLDWAQVNDYTCVMVLDVGKRELVAMERFKGVDWALQRGRLMALYDRWQPHLIIAEKNSIGSPNIEALQREGLPVRSFTTTARSKPPLIESLVLAFERSDIKILNDEILIGELEAYERSVSTYTGHSRYAAPSGLHDDTVMALALAWYGLHQRSTTLDTVENIFYG
ncbi:MAG: terminase family protein [Chloroflexi bacterium]|nr:terminase family protein [Chloroflexota bacterium]